MPSWRLSFLLEHRPCWYSARPTTPLQQRPLMPLYSCLHNAPACRWHSLLPQSFALFCLRGRRREDIDSQRDRSVTMYGSESNATLYRPLSLSLFVSLVSCFRARLPPSLSARSSVCCSSLFMCRPLTLLPSHSLSCSGDTWSLLPSKTNPSLIWCRETPFPPPRPPSVL